MHPSRGSYDSSCLAICLWTLNSSYNSQANSYLAAYYQRDPSYPIAVPYARRLDTNGLPVGAPFAFGAKPDEISYCAVADTYLVGGGIWADRVPAPYPSPRVHLISGVADQGDNGGQFYGSSQILLDMPNVSMSNDLAISACGSDGQMLALVSGSLPDGQGGYTGGVETYGQLIALDSPRPRLTAIQDPQGNVTTLSYDANGHLDRVSGPTGARRLDFTHNAQGQVTAISDHTGRGVSYSYDGQGRLTGYTDPRQNTWTYTYSGTTTLLSEVIDPDGVVVERTLFDLIDGQYRAVRQEKGNGSETQTVVTIDYPDANTRVVTERGVAVTDTYSDGGLLIGQSDAAGSRVFGFDGGLNRDRVEDARGNITRYVIQPNGLTDSITDADQNTTTFTYDANHNLQSSTDARQRTTYYRYDPQNRLISTTNALHYETLYQYNPRGQVTKITDERTNTTEYGYDLFGNRTVITDALNHVTTFGYDDLGRVVTTTDALGKVTLNQYDANNNLTQVTENYRPGLPQNAQNEFNLITHYQYDGANRRTLTTDTLGRVTRNVYDSLGQLDYVVQNEHPTLSTPNYLNEYNLITDYGYDAFGRQETVTDPHGNMTRTFYDPLGRVERTVVNTIDGVYDPNRPDEDIVTTYQYDPDGNLTHTTDTLSRLTRTFYDDLNRVERTVVNTIDGVYDPNQPDQDIVTVFGYDAVGNQTLITDTLQRVTQYDYDDLNRVETVTANYVSGGPVDHETNVVTRYTYDPAGNQETVTDGELRMTHYAYDPLNRVETVTANYVPGGPSDAATNVTTVTTYDPLGRRLTVTDGRGNTLRTGYDTLGRTIAITDAATNVTQYTYDPLGNRETMIDPEGRVTRTEYDSLNRVTTMTANYVPGGPVDHQTNVTTVTGYDALSRRTQLTDANQQTTRYGYDRLGRTITLTDANTFVSRITYDGLGNQLTLTNPEQEITTQQYDALNRLIRVTNPLNQATEYRYNGVGERVAMLDAELVETRYTYDDLSRLSGVIENYVSGTYSGVPDQDVTTRYGYDAVGNRTEVTNALGYTTVYTYDALNRLESMADPLDHTTRYGYDRAGNRTSVLDANNVTTLFSYDDANRLTGIDYGDTTPDVSFSYDGLGNRLSMLDGSGTTSYSYDPLYRLTGVNDGAGAQIGYGYDRVGNRRALTYPLGATVVYTYDAANRLDQVLDWNGGVYQYSYDDANRLQQLTFPNGVVSDYAYDGAGRLFDLTHTQNGQLLAQYSYLLDRVGNRQVATETLTLPPARWPPPSRLPTLTLPWPRSWLRPGTRLEVAP